MKILNATLIFLFCTIGLLAQNTVGLINIDSDNAFLGYNLFFPHNTSTIYLIDNCGEVVHTWEDGDDYRPGNMAYLQEDGNLIRCKRFFNPTLDAIWAGGGGEIVEQVDWEGNVQWSFRLNNEFDRLHHDVAVMPNGNVLMIAWELRTLEDCVQAGRDPNSLAQEKLWPDYIIEYNPNLESIVWEWHAWDHLIQDFDETKDNFGVVSEHPELIDVNYDVHEGHPDWLHANSIDYNAELDQILLSIPHFDEIWIIDHSTTTEEARGHSGGNSGRGGDLLFRWGNPITYRGTGPQQVFFAHDAHWNDDFLSPATPFFGDIMIFNNRLADNTISTVDIIRPSFNAINGQYATREDLSFLPNAAAVRLFHPDTFPLYSSGLSSGQLLPNENILALAGRTGEAFEINPVTNEVVWDYKIPLRAGNPVAQGETLTLNQNITFRLKRYPADYPAFTGRDLASQGHLELTPNTTFCNLSVSIENVSLADLSIDIYPNPASDNLIIAQKEPTLKNLFLTDATGRILKNIALESNRTTVDVSELSAGLYFLRAANGAIGKVIIF